jgi:flagellar motor switch protein FliG
MSHISPSIRKAAVLVSALDERAADMLLEQMGADMSGKVRYALMLLDDITAEEQQRVLNDFFAGSAPAPKPSAVEPEDDVLLDLSPQIDAAEISAPAANVDWRRSAESAPADELLRLLQTAAADDLAQVLAREQPLTIAIIVARLDPARAAQILERLPAPLATEALARLAWLGEPAPEALTDIARHLETQLAAIAHHRPSIAAVQALLEQMEEPRRGKFLQALAARDERLAIQLQRGLLRETSQPYHVESHRYRIEESAAQSAQRDESRATPVTDRRRDIPHIEFEDLQRLDDASLRQVFAAADPQIVLLALTGADEALLARIVRQLPPRDAAVLRDRLSHPGALRLSDIRQAQEQLVRVARCLAADGTIVLPGTRHFAAAA